MCVCIYIYIYIKVFCNFQSFNLHVAGMYTRNRKTVIETHNRRWQSPIWCGKCMYRTVIENRPDQENNKQQPRPKHKCEKHFDQTIISRISSTRVWKSCLPRIDLTKDCPKVQKKTMRKNNCVRSNFDSRRIAESDGCLFGVASNCRSIIHSTLPHQNATKPLLS